MIRKIFLKKMDSLSDDNIKEIEFSDRVNVIIGPKGGGKSTLFDLLAGLKNGYISKSVTDALEAYNLEFVKAEKFNGEIILSKQLSKKNVRDKEKDLTERNDVIFQDDPIKKNINLSESVEKEKFEYVKQVIERSTDSIEEYIKKIKTFYDQIKNIVDLSAESKINWTNTFLFQKTEGDINIISQLNYNSRDIKSKIDSQLRKIRQIIEKIQDDTTFWKTPSNKNTFSEFVELNDDSFNKEYSDLIDQNIKQLESIRNILLKKQKQLEKISNIIFTFEKVYTKRKDEIKKENFKEQGLKTFEKESKDHVKTLASQIVKLQKTFKELILNSDLEIKLNIFEKESKSFLSYKLDEVKTIDEDVVLDSLKVVLYTPRSQTDLSKWIIENQKYEKGFKNFENEKILNLLARRWKDDVKVFANGMDYSKMSLGQKSIYGIKYKFNKSKDDDIFLDQPEDNLDNNTIATSVLDMINEKVNNQVFIVTHNANIGILSKPGKVIVANLNNENNEYLEGSIASTPEHESETSFYLEGGSRFLEERYKIVKGK